jgi:SAM-dependent methyltransferase
MGGALKSVAKKFVPPAARRAIRMVFPYRAPQALDDNLRYASYQPLHSQQFINIGAGDFFHPYWTNIDHGSAHYAKDQKHEFVEYDLNAMRPLPLESASISLAYTSHTIEHVKDAAVQNFFFEVHRVLKPHGIFRVTCPDADLFYLSIKLARLDYWHWRRDFFGYRENVGIDDYAIREVATERVGKISHDLFNDRLNALGKEEFFDWLVTPCTFNQDKPGRHINWWNFDKCRVALAGAGFRTIWRSSYGASLASPMQDTKLFDATWPVMSFYAEAVKD